MPTDEQAVLRRAVRDMLDADDLCLPDPDDFRVGDDSE
jgi:hypothetical protein